MMYQVFLIVFPLSCIAAAWVSVLVFMRIRSWWLKRLEGSDVMADHERG